MVAACSSSSSRLACFLDAFVNKCIRVNKLLLLFAETERQIACNGVKKKICRAQSAHGKYGSTKHSKLFSSTICHYFVVAVVVFPVRCYLTFRFIEQRCIVMFYRSFATIRIAREQHSTHESTMRNQFQHNILFIPCGIFSLKNIFLLVLSIPFWGFSVTWKWFFSTVHQRWWSVSCCFWFYALWTQIEPHALCHKPATLTLDTIRSRIHLIWGIHRCYNKLLWFISNIYF